MIAAVCAGAAPVTGRPAITSPTNARAGAGARLPRELRRTVDDAGDMASRGHGHPLPVVRYLAAIEGRRRAYAAWLGAAILWKVHVAPAAVALGLVLARGAGAR